MDLHHFDGIGDQRFCGICQDGERGFALDNFVLYEPVEEVQQHGRRCQAKLVRVLVIKHRHPRLINLGINLRARHRRGSLGPYILRSLPSSRQSLKALGTFKIGLAGRFLSYSLRWQGL